ncbi:MAG: hypothetical protein ABUL63_04525, partial [Acidobacteriota bacterium]
SGEASPATRALVEEHLARDPELARLVRDAEGEEGQLNRAGREIAVPPSAGKAALETTRHLLRQRSWLMALAIACTLLPFSFAADDDGIQFLLLTAAPTLSSALFAVAAGLWIALWRVSRRLRVTGL